MSSPSHTAGAAQGQKGLSSERGASLVEYALLVALIAVISIAALRTMFTNFSAQFEYLGRVIRGA